jgi:protein NrfC
MCNKNDLSALKNEGLENVSMQDRRDFLKMGLVITGIVAGGTMFSAISGSNKVFASAAEFKEKYPYKPHYAMIIRQNLCIDCELCVEACAKTNHVPAEGYRTRILQRDMPEAVGQNREFIPVLCNHCNIPQCVRVCPTRATYKDKTNGIVQMDTKKCIGCLTCQLGCPYDARYFSEVKHAVDKCNFCWDTKLSKGDKLTACVEACPTGTRTFGDLSDPSSGAYKWVHQMEKTVWVLRPESGTKPNVFYTRG